MNYYNEYDRKTAAWLRELIKVGAIPDGHVDERSIAEVSPDDLRGFTQCHFFAGIGGWSLALQLAGWPSDRPVWTGSCPCQPFSTVGKGLGDKDERHLWPVFANLIRECRPAIVFGEQVASAAGRSWLDGVLFDLGNMGYAGAAADLCAAGVGAPHIRQRIYWGGVKWGEPVVFASDCECGCGESDCGGECGCDLVCAGCGGEYAECGCIGPNQDGYDYDERGGMLFVRRVGDSEREGLEGHSRAEDARYESRRQCASKDRPSSAPSVSALWDDYEAAYFTGGETRRIQRGTLPLADGVPARVVRLRGYGNAIVPQVAQAFIEAFIETINF